MHVYLNFRQLREINGKPQLQYKQLNFLIHYNISSPLINNYCNELNEDNFLFYYAGIHIKISQLKNACISLYPTYTLESELR